jgi:hypothetical protein
MMALGDEEEMTSELDVNEWDSPGQGALQRVETDRTETRATREVSEAGLGVF